MTSRPTLPPELETWLADHPELSPGDLASPWRLAEGANPLDAAPAPDPARIEAIEAALAQAAANGTAPRPALRLVKSARPVYWMAAAACIALLLAVGVLLTQNPTTTVRAASGQYYSALLPDGSKVLLNSDATLRYPRSFGTAERRVELVGEAFFEVAKAEIPFIIETFNATVTVLGTSFNVRAVPDDSTPETIVSVETGIVEVAAKNAPDNAIRLEAGQATRVARATALSPLPSVATDWRRFVLLNQPLGVMFDEIERRFGIEIIASEQIRVHLHNIGTTARSAEQLVIEICQSSKLKLRYRATANGFEVFEAEP